jgi:hypothetical protein
MSCLANDRRFFDALSTREPVAEVPVFDEGSHHVAGLHREINRAPNPHEVIGVTLIVCGVALATWYLSGLVISHDE